jgi:predicted RNase H-like HicB family nuclease
MKTKDLTYYLKLRYTLVLIPEEDGWGALALELPACIGAGDTIAEALSTLEEAKRVWFEYRLDEGEYIPEPLADPHALVSQWMPLHLKRG